MTTDTETPLWVPSAEALRTALITRADAIAHHLGGADNTRRLAYMVAVHGWPDRSLVAHDGALAALLLAARAHIDYQATWRAKLENALRAGAVGIPAYGALLASIAAKQGTAA